jgi:hypothetical protein
MGMRHLAGCGPDGNGEAICRVVLFMAYIAVPYIVKQFVRDQSRTLFVGIGQYDDKFFPAISDHKIIRSCDTLRKGLSDNLKAFITFKMTIRIVVALEEVNVDHQQA